MALRYLLDTNSASYYIAGEPSAVRRRLQLAGAASTAISVVTEAELRYGIALHPSSRRVRSVEAFLANAEVLPWDTAAATAYGPLRATQERKGRPLSAEDLMIAAHALALGLVLVTSDRAFAFVEGLGTEDWTRP